MTLVRVTDGPTARYLPATGLMLISTSVESMLDALTSNSPDDQDDVLSFLHEVIHHLQALSSAYLWQSAMSSVTGSFDIINPKSPDDRERAIEQVARRERAWRFRAYGVSVADLCEGSAVLESFKALVQKPSVGDFLSWRDRAFPGKGNSVYRRTFDILADECGPDAAFDLLPVITLFALQGDIPGRSFELLVSHEAIRDEKLVGAPAAEILSALDMKPFFLATLTETDLEQIHPDHEHPTLLPSLFEIVRTFGSDTFENFARPHRALKFPLDQMILPPLMVGAHRQGGNISSAFGVARTDKDMRLRILMFSALFAAARQIVTGTEDFIPCPHKGCPNHATGLCSGYFVPPPDPSSCRFREEVITLAGKELHEIAMECKPLLDGNAMSRMNSNNDHFTLFPSAEQMPLMEKRKHPPRAELFDRRHLLDPEDNDGLMMLTCSNCGHFWWEWASRRKVSVGFLARCPNCGGQQQVDADRVMMEVPMD